MFVNLTNTAVFCKQWSTRSGAPRPGNSPGPVFMDSVTSGQSRGAGHTDSIAPSLASCVLGWGHHQQPVPAAILPPNLRFSRGFSVSQDSAGSHCRHPARFLATSTGATLRGFLLKEMHEAGGPARAAELPESTRPHEPLISSDKPNAEDAKLAGAAQHVHVHTGVHYDTTRVRVHDVCTYHTHACTHGTHNTHALMHHTRAHTQHTYTHVQTTNTTYTRTHTTRTPCLPFPTAGGKGVQAPAEPMRAGGLLWQMPLPPDRSGAPSQKISRRKGQENCQPSHCGC